MSVDAPGGRLRSAIRLVRHTYEAWYETHASFMAAALAFYALISIAPLLILLVFLAGSLLGPDEVERQVEQGLGTVFGPELTGVLHGLTATAYDAGQRWIASIIGVLVIAYGSSRVFVELQRALRAIWHDPEEPPRWSGVVWWVRTQLLSFLMVIGVGVLWLVGMLGSTAIAATDSWVGDRVPEALRFAATVHTVASVGLLTLALTFVYRYLPGRRVHWRHVWLGAVLTSVALTIGQKLIGIYLGYRIISSAYGAAGSLVAVLFWFYYSWTVFLLGAVFTRVYATRKRPRRRRG